MQVVVLVNYILELTEGYMKGWLIKPQPWDEKIIEEQQYYSHQQSMILYTNRAIQVMTEAPLLAV
jgi:hypothetical protein